jgi:hypothetical protein
VLPPDDELAALVAAPEAEPVEAPPVLPPAPAEDESATPVGALGVEPVALAAPVVAPEAEKRRV